MSTTPETLQELAQWVPPQDPLAALDAFTRWLENTQGITPYPAQIDALTALALGDSVILATPTGTGKSTVALGAHFLAYTAGTRTVYTAPIKALVSEKFFNLVEVFGASEVGMVTGDFTINPDAPILCATAEIVAQYALSDPAVRGITQIVMDEFHFYADPDRGWAWQVPLLTVPAAQFLLMSATLGDTAHIAAGLKTVTGRDVTTVTGAERPVPLEFNYCVQPLQEIITEAISAQRAPLYLVHFSHKQATDRAQTLTGLSLLDTAEKQQLKAALTGFRFSAGYGHTLLKLLRQGIAVHHAGLLPKYRRLVEQLAQRGLVKVICGTDTLGVGINVPIRTVVFTTLIKFDGRRERRITAREFHQIAGRAGRAGFDTVGYVIVAAPEHEVANAAAAAKAVSQQAKNPGKKVKPPKKVAPPQGVSYSAQTFEKLTTAPAEPLQSKLRVSANTLLAFLSRGEETPGELLRAGRKLVAESHETPAGKAALLRQSLQLLRSFLAAGVVERVAATDGPGVLLQTVEISDSGAGSLTSPLSMFAVAALELLDPESETYALDVISLVEATLEDPRTILVAQEKRLKTELLAELKADGVEYAERMQLLDEVQYPQPLAELIDAAFTKYVAATPWAARYEPQPKSIVRDMVENAFGFRDFINHYGLNRAEGSLLRYLSDAYRALARGIPDTHKNTQLQDIINWLGELVRQTDSSLLDEWEQLAALAAGAGGAAGNEAVGDSPLPEAADAAPPGGNVPPGAGTNLTANQRAFEIMVRNAMFRIVTAIAQDRVDQLVELSTPATVAADATQPRGLQKHAWNAALDDYYAEYDSVSVAQDARAKQLCTITAQPGAWQLEQIVVDPDGDLSWAVFAECDLELSDTLGEPALIVTAFRQR